MKQKCSDSFNTNGELEVLRLCCRAQFCSTAKTAGLSHLSLTLLLNRQPPLLKFPVALFYFPIVTVPRIMLENLISTVRGLFHYN